MPLWLLACQFWQQEAVLLSFSPESKLCRYRQYCDDFWETVWAHNHCPVKRRSGAATLPKINTQAYREMHTCAQANIEGYGCANMCTYVKNGLLPNIMAHSSISLVAVCINTSGQYNFTHRHLHTCPPSPWKKIRFRSCQRESLLPHLRIHRPPLTIILLQQFETTLTRRLEWLNVSDSRTSKKSMPGHEWGDLQMNEISPLLHHWGSR